MLAEDLPFGDYERVVLTLVAQGGEKLRVLYLSRTSAIFQFRRRFSTVQIAVLRYSTESPDETARELKALSKSAGDLVLVGGGREARRALKRAQPFFGTGAGGLVHIGSAGSHWKRSPRCAHRLLLPFAEKSSGVRSDPTAWASLLEATSEERRKADEAYKQLSAFGQLFQRSPVATLSIAAALAAVFALELILGGPSSPPVLVRLGALVPSRVAAGEWWRLASCTFLHADWMHLLLNVCVLLLLGSVLECLFGTARFLLLYGASALVGSLGSALLSNYSMSVGASGAIFGLLGAYAVLTYHPQGQLPSLVIRDERTWAWGYLAITIIDSLLRPDVDMWAHFTGGAAGALLLGLGLCTRNLPRLWQEKPDRGERSVASRIPTPVGIRVATGSTVCLLLAGPLLALLLGRPFDLMRTVAMESTRLEELGLAVELPPHLVKHPAQRTQTGTGLELFFGEVLSDPMSVGLSTAPVPPQDEADLAAAIEDLKKSLPTPENASLLAEPSQYRRGDDVGLTVSYSYPSGLIQERALLYLETRLIRVDVLRWPAHPRAAPEGSARRIAESAK